jgi:hypothetical protein
MLTIDASDMSRYFSVTDRQINTWKGALRMQAAKPCFDWASITFVCWWTESLRDASSANRKFRVYCCLSCIDGAFNTSVPAGVGRADGSAG